MDTFFTTSNCDRCNTSLTGKSRKLSWFTDECLCDTCVNDEISLKEKLRKQGINTDLLEGCGYVPKE